MFENVGAKIKLLAKIVCTIEIIACIIIGLYFLMGPEEPIVFFICVVVGSISSWAFSLFIYGFGELIEKVTFIANNIKQLEEVNEETE